MTHLQILRAALQAGYSLQLDRLDDGYHIAATGPSQAGTPYVWEAVDGRLDQAINQLAVQLGLLGNQENPQ